MWQEIAKSREQKVVEVEQENAILRDEMNILKLEVSNELHFRQKCVLIGFCS